MKDNTIDIWSLSERDRNDYFRKEANRAIRNISIRDSVVNSWLGDNNGLDTKGKLAFLREKSKELSLKISIADKIALIYGLLSKLDIHIDCYGDFVRKEDSVRFITPFLYRLTYTDDIDNRMLDCVVSFTQNCKKVVKCRITNRNAKNFTVFYSGVLDNGEGETIGFNEVNNGFCVNLD